MKVVLVERTPTVNVIAIEGYLGIDYAQKIEKEFKQLTLGLHRSSIVDLHGVSFISSFGVRLFLDVAQGLEKEGKKLVVIRPQPEVREVLVSCEMDTVVGIFETKEAALAAL